MQILGILSSFLLVRSVVVLENESYNIDTDTEFFFSFFFVEIISAISLKIKY